MRRNIRAPYLQRSRITWAQKLQLLRNSDGFREWHSLRDRRVCVLCERKFSGRQARVERASGGGLEVKCPTRGCNSTPHEWVYPGNPLVSEASWRDWLRVFTENEARA